MAIISLPRMVCLSVLSFSMATIPWSVVTGVPFGKQIGAAGACGVGIGGSCCSCSFYY